jgi:integrase
MNTLSQALQQYVLMRRGFGFKFENQQRRLTSFVRFMDGRAATIITRKLALEWAMLPAYSRASWALRLTDVRGFARYRRIADIRTEVPPVGILVGSSRPKPYLYTDEEIQKLLTAALRKFSR